MQLPSWQSRQLISPGLLTRPSSAKCRCRPSQVFGPGGHRPNQIQPYQYRNQQKKQFPCRSEDRSLNPGAVFPQQNQRPTNPRQRHLPRQGRASHRRCVIARLAALDPQSPHRHPPPWSHTSADCELHQRHQSSGARTRQPPLQSCSGFAGPLQPCLQSLQLL